MGCSNESSISSGGNKVLVVVGPSGVGKDTVMQKVLEKYPEKFKKGVTHTSRKMRPGEKEGHNYYYRSKEEFLKLKEEGGLIEYFFYNGNYYGLSKKELENGTRGQKISCVNIGVDGAKSLHDLKIPSNYFAILPPNEEVLEKRLKRRGTESLDLIKERIEASRIEIKKINELDFLKYKIVNNDLGKAVLEMENKLKELYPQLK